MARAKEHSQKSHDPQELERWVSGGDITTREGILKIEHRGHVGGGFPTSERATQCAAGGLSVAFLAWFASDMSFGEVLVFYGRRER